MYILIRISLQCDYFTIIFFVPVRLRYVKVLLRIIISLTGQQMKYG